MSGAEWLFVLGAGLEFAGVVAVGFGVTKTRREFAPHLPGIMGSVRITLTRFRDWVLGRRAGDVEPVSVSATVTIPYSVAHGTDAILTADWQSLDTDGRVEYLYQRDASLESRLERLAGRISDDRRQAREALAQEVGRIEVAASELDVKFGKLAVGGLRLQAGGVAMLLAGIVFTGLGSILAAG